MLSGLGIFGERSFRVITMFIYVHTQIVNADAQTDCCCCCWFCLGIGAAGALVVDPEIGAMSLAIPFHIGGLIARADCDDYTWRAFFLVLVASVLALGDPVAGVVDADAFAAVTRKFPTPALG